MRACATNKGWTSIWESVVRDRRGRIKQRCKPHSNLRVNSGNDWQALLMAGTVGNTNIFATASGSATSTTATTLVTGTGFPTAAVVNGATGGLAGQIVVASSDAGSNVYGVILSNTATTLTVDRWVTAAAPFTTAATPAATAKYTVLQGMAPCWYLGLSTTVQSGAAGDVVLAGEITTADFKRTQATSVTHTAVSSAFSFAKTFVAASSVTISSEGAFTATGAAGVGAAATSGILVFESAMPSPPALVSGDTIAETVLVQY